MAVTLEDHQRQRLGEQAVNSLIKTAYFSDPDFSQCPCAQVPQKVRRTCSLGAAGWP
jgi:hypothetical protein